jgi:hypothetical protein
MTLPKITRADFFNYVYGNPNGPTPGEPTLDDFVAWLKREESSLQAGKEILMGEGAASTALRLIVRIAKSGQMLTSEQLLYIANFIGDRVPKDKLDEIISVFDSMQAGR